MASNLGRTVTNLEGLLPIMILYLLVTWFCEIKGQTKNIYPYSLWPPNLAGWWLILSSFYPCYSTLWSRGPARLRDKLKLLYLHYHNAYSHLIHQLGRMVINPHGLLPLLLYHLLTWSCEIKWQTKTISSLPRCLWLPNLARVWLSIRKSHHPWITWSYEITWQTKIIISPLLQNLWPQNIAGWWLNLSGF